MAVIIALGLLGVGTVLLLWGADWFIDGVRDLAPIVGISPLVLGIILVGLEPEEMLIAAWASGQGAGRLALGNVIGTNITIVALALGLSAVIMPIVLDRSIRRQALLATLISLPPIVLLLLGPINRIVGLLLLILFAGYTYFLLHTDRKAFARLATAEMGDNATTTIVLTTQDEDEDEDRTENKIGDETTVEPGSGQRLWIPIGMTLGGLVALGIAGFVVVRGALQLAGGLGLDQEVIGSTIVALGTGAEMVALGVAAARKKQVDVLVGGILGSFAYNLLVTLGLAAVVNPLPALPELLRGTLWIMVGVHLLLLALVWRGKIGRGIGIGLLIVYSAYLATTIISGILLAH